MKAAVTPSDLSQEAREDATLAVQLEANAKNKEQMRAMVRLITVIPLLLLLLPPMLLLSLFLTSIRIITMPGRIIAVVTVPSIRTCHICTKHYNYKKELNFLQKCSRKIMQLPNST